MILMSGDHLRQRAFARSVRTHNGMDFAGGDLEAQAV